MDCIVCTAGELPSDTRVIANEDESSFDGETYLIVPSKARIAGVVGLVMKAENPSLCLSIYGVDVLENKLTVTKQDSIREPMEWDESKREYSEYSNSVGKLKMRTLNSKNGYLYSDIKVSIRLADDCVIDDKKFANIICELMECVKKLSSEEA